MCGIAGILSSASAGAGAPDPGTLDRMLSAQRHRGPDGRGAFRDGPLVLGAVRLAVLDRTEAARQPMSTSEGRFTLAYNGEVYNYRDLRRELEGLGTRFRSSGDTEVVLQALARWGEGALPRLNGAFALAFWDARERRLLLARDRLGLRPLYWAEAGGDLVFASEIKGILASGRVKAALDGAALAELFRFQNVWSPRTLFAGILPLPLGACLRVKDARLQVDQAWRFDFPGDLRIPEAEAVAGLKARLEAAVTRQLVSEVPVGAALSGGLDGAAVVSEAVRSLPDLRTFTVGFERPSPRPGERAVDERFAAAGLAKRLGTRHAEAVVSPADAIRDLPALVRHLEEPRLAASSQNLAAARLAAGEVTVLLSGGGGDELFAGYPWRYAPVLRTETPEAFALALGKVWSRVLAPGEEEGFWADEGKRLVAQGDPEGVLRQFSEEAGDVPPLHRIMSVEASTFLPAYCVLEDKLHMAMGAEVRSPLLDHELLDWARRLPVSLRLGVDGSGKSLLRKALAGRLPDSVLQASKQGFVSPLLSWCAGEPWKGFLKKTLMGPPFTERGLIRSEAVRRDVEAVVAGRPEPLQRVWTCLAFELWCREFLDLPVQIEADSRLPSGAGFLSR